MKEGCGLEEEKEWLRLRGSLSIFEARYLYSRLAAPTLPPSVARAKPPRRCGSLSLRPISTRVD